LAKVGEFLQRVDVMITILCDFFLKTNASARERRKMPFDTYIPIFLIFSGINWKIILEAMW
jgi:hypothetical protein